MLPVAGSEKMPLDFDEKFEEGTFGLTKTQIGEEIFTRWDDVQIISISPNGKYGFLKRKNRHLAFSYMILKKRKELIYGQIQRIVLKELRKQLYNL